MTASGSSVEEQSAGALSIALELELCRRTPNGGLGLLLFDAGA